MQTSPPQQRLRVCDNGLADRTDLATIADGGECVPVDASVFKTAGRWR